MYLNQIYNICNQEQNTNNGILVSPCCQSAHVLHPEISRVVSFATRVQDTAKDSVKETFPFGHGVNAADALLSSVDKNAVLAPPAG